MKSRPYFHWLTAVIAAAALSACAGGAGIPGAGRPSVPFARSGSSSAPIQHVVIVVQENRTFNNFFATFPGAVGTTTGYERVGKGKKAKTVPIALTEVNLEDKKNLNHLYVSYQTAYDNGNMDAFNLIKYTTNNKPEGAAPYQYVNPAQVQPYWTLAQEYGLADEMFQTQGSGSFTAHQDLIRGGTEIDSGDSLVDDPTSASAWGCDSPAGTVTSLITTTLKYEGQAGPFPCTNKFPSSGSYETLADLLDAGSITWKYYTPKFVKSTPGALWNAFDVIAAVRNGPEWTTNVSMPQTNILKDVSNGKLPAVSWVIPDANDSDHPGYSSDTGPSWVSSIVNAIGGSSYWNSTAIIIVWDDWGGFYDPVAPPTPLDTQGGPGFRVPMLVVSPYVPQGEISNTPYEFGSILQFVENNWGLGCLGTTDCTATSIADMFAFNKKARKFKKVQSKYPASYFLHEKPSGLPVDTQ